MQFAGKRVWVPKSTTELGEEIDEEDVKKGVRFTSAKMSSRAHPVTPSPKVRVAQGANTNVVLVPLGELKEQSALMTGDLVTCQQCAAAFSHVSKIAQASVDNNNNVQQEAPAVVAEGKGVWTCEFCAHPNVVSIEKEEIPTSAQVDYVISGPTTELPSDTAYSVVFVVDTSGSMCCTVPVVGGLKLKGGPKQSAEVLAFREGGAAQYLPNEKHGEQYVSRLQCVVAAVEAQVEALKKSKPNVRVGLVTFASDVCILGDATTAPVVVTGDKLSNEAALLAAGSEFHDLAPISQSSAKLIQSLYALEERGTTALGPGLLVAQGMLSAAQAGSKIVLLTDGLANEGCGSLEFANMDMAAADSFYRRAAQQAKQQGISCSVVAIKGTECKMEVLGMIAEESGGEVDIVDPTSVAKNFATILEDEVFATECELKMLLHSGMVLLDPEFEGKSNALKSVGNITALSKVSFEFRVRTDQDAEILSKQSRLPFQVQIRYRKLDGSRLIRVITETQDITADRTEAEKDVDVDIVASNAVQQAAGYSSAGNYAQARSKMVAQQRLMVRASEQQPNSGGYANFVENAMELDDALLEQEEAEAPAANDEEQNERRRQTRPDKLSKAIYAQKQGKQFWRK